MKLRNLAVVLAITSSVAASACSRNAIEAVNLANEADKQRSVDPEGAIQKYEQAVTLDPSNHRILYKLAMTYRKKEAWDKVASTLAKAGQIAPAFANYWYERGYAIEEQAMKKTVSWEEAREPFEKCIKADPNLSDCYHELGNVNLWTDKEQDALAFYTKAIEHKADESRYYLPLGELYLNLGYLDEAEKTLKEGISFLKDGDKAAYGLHVLLSSVYQQKGKGAERVAELEAAKKAGGDEHPESLFNLGSTYAVIEPPRKQEAISMLKAFTTRACRGGAAAKYKDQCEQSQALIAKLGGTQ